MVFVLKLFLFCWIYDSIRYIGFFAYFGYQVGTRKELQEKATLSLMTRILDDIEDTEDYEP